MMKRSDRASIYRSRAMVSKDSPFFPASVGAGLFEDHCFGIDPACPSEIEIERVDSVAQPQGPRKCRLNDADRLDTDIRRHLLHSWLTAFFEKR